MSHSLARLALVLALGCNGAPATDGDAAVLPDGDVLADASGDTSSIPEPRPFDPRDPIVVLPTLDPAELSPPQWDESLPGDMLFSRTGRGCLSVVGEDLSTGARLEVSICRGTDGQRWSDVDGVLSLAEAPDLCADADVERSREGFFLTDCSAIATPYRLTPDGVLDRGDWAADVTHEEGLLVTYPTHGGDNQRWRWLADDRAFLEDNAAHAITYPLPVDDAIGYAIEATRHRVASIQPPYPLVARPDVSQFPGEIGASAPLASREVRFDRRFDHDVDYLRTGPVTEHWQSTGLYARPGQPLVVIVPAEADGAGLFVRINQHTDVLLPTSGNVTSRGAFDRLPQVALRIPVEAGENWLRSPYGGLIILESTVDTGRTLSIEIHGAVEAPRFVRGVTTADEWTVRRRLGVPWAEIEGDHAVIVVPTEQVRELADPEAVAERYDRIVEHEADIFGLDFEAEEGLHRMYDGKTRFVADPQPRAGYGHAGFPIMASPEWNLARERDFGDDWGVWHELGHNHQQFCLWATRFHSEASVNIFSLYVEESVTDERHLAGLDVLAVGRLLAGRLDFESGDVWDKLVFLMQPVWAFPEIDWEVYRRVNRAYRELSDDAAEMICDSPQRQLDTFYRLLSEATEHDLRDHFRTWGLAPTAEAMEDVEELGLPVPDFAVSEITRY